ncbi:MAG: carbon-nitrogen family hydrolase [Proteobacteria bacterium]|nr:carbon-nitrogen family hydrolase [Pseudomonadota bacterium]
MRAGILQFNVALGNVAANLSRVRAGLRDLARRGAELVVLPEMWSCGFDNLRLAEHARRTPGVLDDLAVEARRLSLWVAGSLPEAADGGVYNTAYVLDADGEIRAAYRKVHLFPMTGESRYFLAGDRAVSCPTPWGRLGILTCFDLRFPELARALAAGGATILAVCAQWPMARIPHWDLLLAARALENQVFAIGANRTGADPDLAFGGRSAVASPGGEILARAPARRGARLVADLDLSEITRTRKTMPCLDLRVPGAYGEVEG